MVTDIIHTIKKKKKKNVNIFNKKEGLWSIECWSEVF